MESPLSPPTSPFLSIWLKPRETIRQLVATDPTKFVIPLALLSGIGQVLDNASSQSTGDNIPFVVILALALILGPIVGLLTIYLGGAIYGWAGGRLGGQASSEEVRAALAWSAVPVIATFPLTLLQTLLLGSEMFTTATPRLDSNPPLALFILVSSIVQLVAGIWAFVLLLQTLSEVQRFSVWRALGSILLPSAIIVIPILLCALGLLLMA